MAMSKGRPSLKGVSLETIFEFFHEDGVVEACKAVKKALYAKDVDGRPDHAIRLRAAKELLDRMAGRPATNTTVEFKDLGGMSIFVGKDLKKNDESED